MSDIRFRGLSINGEWYYGLLSHSLGYSSQPEGGYYISNSAGQPWAYQVRPETVGEYIGLKDKNGKECFHKDICKYLDDSNTQQIGIIEWMHCGFYLKAIGGDDEGNQDGDMCDASGIEIIGNKFENEDLLNAKK